MFCTFVTVSRVIAVDYMLQYVVNELCIISKYKEHVFWHWLLMQLGTNPVVCGLCGAIGTDDYDDVYSKPQCRKQSCVPGLSLWPMWTMSCIFHNVPRVTMWQLLGRETMQGTFLVLSAKYVTITYKLCLFMHQIHNREAPPYLSDCVSTVSSSCHPAYLMPRKPKCLCLGTSTMKRRPVSSTGNWHPRL